MSQRLHVFTYDRKICNYRFEHFTCNEYMLYDKVLQIKQTIIKFLEKVFSLSTIQMEAMNIMLYLLYCISFRIGLVVLTQQMYYPHVIYMGICMHALPYYFNLYKLFIFNS